MGLKQFAIDIAKLSPRELEVMSQVGMGYSNPEIAESLGLARRTVENTIVRANKRFEVKLGRSMFVRMWNEARNVG